MIASGTEGSCPWTIDDNGVLTIGAGQIRHGDGIWSWADYASQVTQVVAQEHITWAAGTNAKMMFYYFDNTTSFDLSGFDTTNVTSMNGMFYHCEKLVTLDLSGFNTSNVTNMKEMFCDCYDLETLDLSSFDTSNVTDMSSMFISCNKLTTLDISSFNTSNVTNMMNMFGSCDSLTTLDLSSFNTGNVTNMAYMFEDCYSLTTLNLNNFNTSNAEYMHGMFRYCPNVSTTIPVNNASFGASDIFLGTTKSIKIAVIGESQTAAINAWTAIANQYSNVSMWSSGELNYGDYTYSRRTDGLSVEVFSKDKTSYGSIISPLVINNVSYNVTSMYGCFGDCSNLVIAPTIPDSVTNMEYCFLECQSLTTVSTLPRNLTEMEYCFYECISLVNGPSEIPSGVRSLNHSFWRCRSLQIAPIIPDTVQVLYFTFASCSSLKTVSAIPSSATYLSYAFGGCSQLTGNIIVNNTPEYYDRMFAETTQPIYIINGGAASETTWRQIADSYPNVHYEASDAIKPDLTFVVSRVDNDQETESTDEGKWSYLQATAVLYDTYLPEDWTVELGRKIITGAVSTVNWSDTHEGLIYTCQGWDNTGDNDKHIYTLQVSSIIRDELGNIKREILSNVLTAVLVRVGVAISVYHDSVQGTEGTAIGMFASKGNIFDIGYETLFNENPYVVLSGYQSPGGIDQRLYDALIGIDPDLVDSDLKANIKEILLRAITWQ